MDVLAIGGKDRAAANETADDREDSFQNRQAEGNNRDRNGDEGGSLLRAVESEGAEKEPDKEAAGISEKDGGGVEVEAKKSDDRAGEGDSHDFNENWTV